ncbi:hypothetical protein [Halohasta litorea]|uniref:Uncharacterized protein n=1 Tax=Halohasta litorea TaxID=869891 RepID=A0ABD6D3K5_9EURY|nr:hypothetical protein [Halohasta litorea]MEA1930156.1 hypothetical protein [Euryarchaeota archaeon]
MSNRQSLEIIGVAGVYLFVFTTGFGPAIESITGFETVSPGVGVGAAERFWELVSHPQGWLLAFGYVPVHFAYLFVRARLAGESVDDYWE